MKLNIDCKDVSRLISNAQDQDLPPAELAQLRLHLVICETCRNVDEQMQFIRRAMKTLGAEAKQLPQ
jgi:predicted anti-sigma-YlaC factor YlaD